MSSEKQIKEEKSMVNDWACAQQLEIFKQRYLDPMEKRYENAKKVFDDPKHRWESDAQRKKAMDKYNEMEGYLDLYKALYGATIDLIHQHEALIDNLSNSYASWYSIVSNKGKQSPEMLQGQADELQKIFTGFYNILKPLHLPIKPPKGIEE